MILSKLTMLKLIFKPISPNLMKVIHVKLNKQKCYLSDERRKVRVLEVFGQDVVGKSHDILDDEGGPLARPRNDAFVVGILAISSHNTSRIS